MWLVAVVLDRAATEHLCLCRILLDSAALVFTNVHGLEVDLYSLFKEETSNSTWNH